jgi:hypothetical protein
MSNCGGEGDGDCLRRVVVVVKVMVKVMLNFEERGCGCEGGGDVLRRVVVVVL